MHKLRRHIHNNSFAWVFLLTLAFVCVSGMKLHIHVHAGHQHGGDVDHHHIHLGNPHDAEHGSTHPHADLDAAAIDISPEGFYKNISITLLAVALIGVIVLLLSPRTLMLSMRRRRDETPPIHRLHSTPPQLRAPPFNAIVL